MVKFIALIIFTSTVASCSKVNTSHKNNEGDILIGSYSGRLPLDGSSEKYQARISKTGTRGYELETQFPDPLPALKIEFVLSQVDLIYLTIPAQVINDETYRGGGGVGIAYDAFFSKGNQRLYLTLQKDGNPDIIVYDAVKLP